MKFLGIITARGGSRGVPGKNIANLAGKPVIAYTITEALKSKLDDCILSTEDEEIAKISKKYGVKVPFMRPKIYATDKAKHAPLLKYTLNKYEQMFDQKFDYILTLQPTSPFRIAEDIDRAIEIADKNQPDCVVSLEAYPDLSIEKLKYLENGIVLDAYKSERKNEGRSRQNRKTLYRRNGAIYLTRRDVLLRGSVYGKNILGFEMPAERSVDINSKIDLEFARFLMKQSKN